MNQPSLSFHNAALKIIWAQQYITNLELSCNAWVEKKPYIVSVETNAEGTSHRLNVGLAEPLPDFFPLLIGDICANLRASLDFAWMGLVRAANPNDPGKRTLPIADNRKGLEATVKQAPIGTAVTKALPLLLDTIRSHRDFEGGGNAFIAALNDLSNWNKHNMLVISAGVTRLQKVRLGGIIVNSMNVQGEVSTPIEFSGVGPPPKFEYEGEPTVEIIFGQHNLVHRQPGVPTLLNMAQGCIDALKAFCEVFPGEGNPTFT